MTQMKDPQAPATAAQESYLASLVSDRELPVVCERYQLLKALGMLTKGQASEWIDQLLKAPKKAPKASTVASQPFAQSFAETMTKVAETAAELNELPKFGYYWIESSLTGQTDLFYWDVTGKDAYPQLRRLQIVTTYTGAKKGSWKKVYGGYSALKVQASWKPYAGKGYYGAGEKTGYASVPKVLAEAVAAGVEPLSVTEAGKLGKQFGFCVRCGATLTDPVSVADGIGPVCKTYWF